MNSRTAIIDGDIVVYRAGFASQDYVHKVVDEEGDVLEEFSSKADANDFSELVAMGEGVKPRIETEILPKAHEDVDMIVDVMIKNVVVGSESTDYLVYLTGDTNFRNELATIKEYKGNRNSSARPVHYQYIRDYMTEQHPYIMSDNCEADDLCAMRLYTEFKKARQSRNREKCEAILCSIDKDLRNIPGWHYNIKDKVIDWVTPKQANKHFASQLLTGDACDNIPGISFLSDKKKKVGPKTAEKMLKEAETLEDLHNAVCEVYSEFAGEDWKISLQEVGSLLWMQREPEQQFDVDIWSKSGYE